MIIIIIIIIIIWHMSKNGESAHDIERNYCTLYCCVGGSYREELEFDGHRQKRLVAFCGAPRYSQSTAAGALV